jgi:hypothetical protein
MSRQFSEYVTDTAKANLCALADLSTNSSDYAQSLYELGKELGDILFTQITIKNKNVCVACTVEDADYLAKGIIESLNAHSFNVSLACFWNQRHATLSIAPIIRKYREPETNKADILVIVKSVISGACVVKTNLTYLIQDMKPQSIFVVAPVMHSKATEKLACEFPREISAQFKYIYFATDSEIQADKNLFPGIGGSIYQRLGFENQDDKNKFTPHLVKERRAMVQLNG